MFVKVLPPEVRSLISAGEIIERPADVVKELVENSLDAEATEIQVELSKGGKNYILVADNGKGIHPDDIEKVILAGATSKIEKKEDLLSIETYGFRGEALHAISKVSRMKIASRFFQETFGVEIEVEGGRIVSKRTRGLPVGTQVEVTDLFYNLPVRRRFLKKEDTELRKIIETLKELALANPNVGFKVISNGREVISLKPSSEIERVSEILGGDVSLTEGDTGMFKFRLYTLRNVSKGKFWVFVNSRPVEAKSIKELLRKILGYKTLGVIFIEIQPILVEVNVHPKKREIKFIKERKVLELLRTYLEAPKNPDLPSLLSQEIGRYDTDIKLVGIVEDTLIVAQRGDYLYFFDQHLLEERILFEKTGSEDVACRQAIKAGTKISKEKAESLLNLWKELKNPHVCPHGRPIYYRLPLKEIYEKLGRIRRS